MGVIHLKVDDGRADTRSITEEWFKRDGKVYKSVDYGRPEVTPFTEVPLVIVRIPDYAQPGYVPHVNSLLNEHYQKCFDKVKKDFHDSKKSV